MTQRALVPKKRKKQIKEGVADGKRGAGFRQKGAKSSSSSKPIHTGDSKQQIEFHLFHGVHSGDLEKIRRVLDGGADIDAQDLSGATSLVMACREMQWNTVQFLVEQGADVSIKTNKGNFALRYAAEYAPKEIVELLLENGANVDDYDDQGRTALFLAASKGHLDIVKFLIEREANDQIRDLNGISPVEIAGQNGHTEVRKYLHEVFLGKK